MIYMTLGQRIKEVRLERQMTQQEVVGDYITRNMLSQIENDVATPSVKTLEYLAKRLGLTLNVFYEGSLREETSFESLLEQLSSLLNDNSEKFPALHEKIQAKWREQGIRLSMLEAEYNIKIGDFNTAERLLESIEQQGSLPEDMNKLYTELELRYRDAGNFEKAYACAIKQR